jgi:4a-hydroxytetrahydrobiopterin dehydratase
MTLTNTRNHSVCEGTAVTLTPGQTLDRLDALPTWKLTVEQKLYRQFSFASFLEAIEFVDDVAVVAERQNHHPTLLVDKRRVEVTIWTRQLGCLTVHDFELAAAIDRLVEVER